MQTRLFRNGHLYNFFYKQPLGGDSRRHLAKVIGIREMTKEDRERLDSESDYRRNDPEFERGFFLITCLMPDGQVRNFYAERTENVREASLFEKFLYYCGLARLFYEKSPL